MNTNFYLRILNITFYFKHCADCVSLRYIFLSFHLAFISFSNKALSSFQAYNLKVCDYIVNSVVLCIEKRQSGSSFLNTTPGIIGPEVTFFSESPLNKCLFRTILPCITTIDNIMKSALKIHLKTGIINGLNTLLNFR
jgi:hypothetical protein